MDVILLEKVQNLGGVGDQVKVRAGYGRNFLLPYGKAVPATNENIKYFEERRAELEQKASEKVAEAEARKEKLAALESVEIASKAGDEGKLFGSIGVKDVADAITAAGVEVGKNEISMPEGPIRNIGEYTLEVQFHPDVSGEVTVNVIPE